VTLNAKKVTQVVTPETSVIPHVINHMPNVTISQENAQTAQSLIQPAQF